MRGNKRAALAQLEKISRTYDRWTEVYQLLVNTYYQLLREGTFSSTERSDLDAEAEARYRLGIELRGKGDLSGAAEQLTAIHPKSKEFDNARSTLAQIYVALGQLERKERHWHKAIEWWDKALAISPSLEGTLRWPIRVVHMRAWLDDHSQELALIGVVFTILAACVGLWQVGVLGPISINPTPTTTLTPTATATQTVTITHTPTATRTRTPTRTHTATHTPSPILTDTPTFTHTPTRTPTRTRIVTPTPSMTSTTLPSGRDTPASPPTPTPTAAVPPTPTPTAAVPPTVTPTS